MSFPQKTFFWNPKWWEDLREVERKTSFNENTGKTIWEQPICDICNRTLHAGKENDKYFLYCQNCMKKFKTIK